MKFLDDKPFVFLNLFVDDMLLVLKVVRDELKIF